MRIHNEISSSFSRPGSDSTLGSSAPTQTSPKLAILWAIGFLVTTAALALVWSHVKLMWIDEFMVLWTDSVQNLSQVVQIQRFYPASLDPVLYHVAAHASIQVFGPTAFALRLPALAGFLLMQACLFIFVDRIAGSAAGIVALAFPATTPAFNYAIEGRPYGLMLGFIGIAMVSWQASVRNRSRRLATLIALALAIAGAVNTHYFGVLVLVPLCAAEGWRTLQQRRFDLPVLCSIVVGAAGIMFVLPFTKSAGEFKTHIYDPNVQLSRIPAAYSMFIPIGGRRFLGFQSLGLIFIAGIVCLSIFLLRNRRKLVSESELVFIFFLAALPFVAFGIAKFVTHTLESRYSLGALVGIAAMAGIALGPIARRSAGFFLISILVLTCAVTTKRIINEEHETRQNLSTLTTSSEVNTYLRQNRNAKIYIQNLHDFALASYYGPDPEIRSRLALLFSREVELRVYGVDTGALTAMHMKRFTPFNIDDFESLKAQPGANLIAVPDRHLPPVDWIKEAIEHSHLRIDPVGPAFGGVAVRLQP
jgi:Dolichyl-phosphate-mannose-protein mannosyltransferase